MKRILIVTAAVIVCSATYTTLMCAPFDGHVKQNTVVRYIITGAVIGLVTCFITTRRKAAQHISLLRPDACPGILTTSFVNALQAHPVCSNQIIRSIQVCLVEATCLVHPFDIDGTDRQPLRGMDELHGILCYRQIAPLGLVMQRTNMRASNDSILLYSSLKLCHPEGIYSLAANELLAQTLSFPKGISHRNRLMICEIPFGNDKVAETYVIRDCSFCLVIQKGSIFSQRMDSIAID